jgi:predicted pyridoxine 5'-phosphate oxidase superfamily flavin-nucleotide-binding protein
MMKMSEDMKQMLDENIVYLATSTKEGKPNVVPIGMAHAINDEQLLVVDVMFKKTRKNLEDNPQVAISFTDVKRWQSYQLKGTATIHTEGEIFDEVQNVMREKSERRKAHTDGIEDLVIKEKVRRMGEWRKKLRPKAAVVVTVEEIYSHMPKLDKNE